MKGSDGPRGCGKSSTSAAMVTLGKRALASQNAETAAGEGCYIPEIPLTVTPSCHFLARFILFPIISFRCIITMNCALIALAITK